MQFLLKTTFSLLPKNGQNFRIGSGFTTFSNILNNTAKNANNSRSFFSSPTILAKDERIYHKRLSPKKWKRIQQRKILRPVHMLRSKGFAADIDCLKKREKPITFALMAREYGQIKKNALETAKKEMKRFLKWTHYRCIMDRAVAWLPKTKKPAEVRMGSGKGKIDHWVCPIKPGKLIFEIRDLPEDKAIFLLKAAKHKIGVKSYITPL